MKTVEGAEEAKIREAIDLAAYVRCARMHDVALLLQFLCVLCGFHVCKRKRARSLAPRNLETLKR